MRTREREKERERERQTERASEQQGSNDEKTFILQKRRRGIGVGDQPELARGRERESE